MWDVRGGLVFRRWGFGIFGFEAEASGLTAPW